MKKILVGLVVGIIIGYWSSNNFISIATNGDSKFCISNSWRRVDTICIWGRNPFGKGPWTLKFSYQLPKFLKAK